MHPSDDDHLGCFHGLATLCLAFYYHRQYCIKHMCPHIFVTMCICRLIAFSMAVGFDFPTSRLGNLCSTFILIQVMGHMVATSDYTWEHGGP